MDHRHLLFIKQFCYYGAIIGQYIVHICVSIASLYMYQNIVLLCLIQAN